MSGLPGVLLTYGWCRVSYVVMQSLARRGVRVHVADCSPLAMCRFSRRRTSFVRCRSPYRDPNGFIGDLVGALKRSAATVLIPGHEDILPIARLKDRFPPAIRIPVGEPETIGRVMNKWQLVDLARAAGVTVPRSFKPATSEDLTGYLSELTFPAVIKTQIGNSAKGVFVVGSAADARARFEKLVATYRLEPDRWPLVQAFAPGHGYGVCLLYNHGELRAAFSERYLRCKDGEMGTSVFRESVEAPLLVAQARRLMDGLRWHGLVHLDFLYEPATGEASLIEVNPRFWGALDLAVRAGVDFPWLLYRLAVDGDVEPVTSYRVGIRSRWIVGELLHLFNHLRRFNFRGIRGAMAALVRERADGFDDFRASDPLPLLAEIAYYATRFAATGSTNPVEEGMIA